MMKENETAGQQETDLQRWADDGGRSPDARTVRRVAPQNPWAVIGLAAAVGFAFGWLSGE